MCGLALSCWKKILSRCAWPGLKHFFIESLQLVSVHCAGDCRVWLQKFLVDYPIYVPPNRQQNLARMEFTFGWGVGSGSSSALTHFLFLVWLTYKHHFSSPVIRWSSHEKFLDLERSEREQSTCRCWRSRMDKSWGIHLLNFATLPSLWSWVTIVDWLQPRVVAMQWVVNEGSLSTSSSSALVSQRTGLPDLEPIASHIWRWDSAAESLRWKQNNKQWRIWAFSSLMIWTVDCEF